MNYVTVSTIVDYAILSLPVYLALVMALDAATRIAAFWSNRKHQVPTLQDYRKAFEVELDLPDYDELFRAAEAKFELKLEGQCTALACSIEDAPLWGQHCQLATPLATPLACPVELAWAQVKPQIDYSTLSIRELKKLANAHNKALPKGHSSRITSVSKLKKAQLIAALTSAA